MSLERSQLGPTASMPPSSSRPRPRRVPALFLLAVLLTATLAACGGDSGDATGQPASGERPADTDTSSASTSAADTPTPEARTQDGAELTTQEYAEALEEALSGPDDEIVEDAFERFFGRNRLSSDETERLWSLENAESWSEEDVRLANKYAEAGQRAATGFFDFVLGLLKRTPEEVSSLRPPKHLSELHRDFAEALGELTRFSLQPMEQLLDEVREADTDIRNREELAEFEALVNSLEFPSVDPEPGQQGEDLSKQAQMGRPSAHPSRVPRPARLRLLLQLRRRRARTSRCSSTRKRWRRPTPSIMKGLQMQVFGSGWRRSNGSSLMKL